MGGGKRRDSDPCVAPDAGSERPHAALPRVAVALWLVALRQHFTDGCTVGVVQGQAEQRGVVRDVLGIAAAVGQRSASEPGRAGIATAQAGMPVVTVGWH